MSLENQRLRILYILKDFHFIIFLLIFSIDCLTQPNKLFAFILGLVRLSIYLSRNAIYTAGGRHANLSSHKSSIIGLSYFVVMIMNKFH